jgi:hypothetical protein
MDKTERKPLLTQAELEAITKNMDINDVADYGATDEFVFGKIGK